MMRRLLPALLLLPALTGCGGDSAGADGKLSVVTAFYPLQFVSERVGGDAVSVSTLTKPGAEPHDVELTARQVGEVSGAGVIVYLGGFQPAVDDAVKQNGGDRALDATTAVETLSAQEADDHAGEGDAHAEEEHGGTDPHVWLDPVRLAAIADKVAERLGKADPAHAADFTARAATLRAELTALDGEYRAGLANCARRELVTSHTAFGYLANRYDLAQIGITGIDPETEPSPQRLAAVAAEAKEHGTTTIFFETLVSPKVAETIAKEVGAKTAVLDPIEGLTDDSADYFSVMRANLTALKLGLECS
ncbi:zinc ABC transporter substrate-binding protein [Actinoplanes philippinensis]|uniref:Zinc transport system substrate-binding protein n=1 Tax=Actinoplanes philippinensis TaxID=35752 RepID=A0A1I2LN16_9ACTN|nr:metal ABC transporter substrate-binding protein [Actinoplanes philippinensis]GIE82687.1 zinc ABC transporter substrate-binding protein [Actinoplanes philippinensis]SFF80665.1 zinc transport system substrate-binding protein [Actinoplanes philippinensis]